MFFFYCYNFSFFRKNIFWLQTKRDYSVSKFTSKYKRYIIISLVAIVIGTGLLAVDNVVSCANSITALFFGLIYLEGNVAFEIYDGWDARYVSECYVKYIMPDCIDRKEYKIIQNIARTIQQGVIDAVQQYIRLNFVRENDYNARNYTFTDDWALAKLKKEPDFTRLVKEQEKIKFVNIPQINENLFFFKEKFCFNIKISKIEFIDLSEKDCAEFLEKYKCHNGLYNVDGALMAKEEAMRCVKNIYCKERYGFKLMIGLNRKNATCIKFGH